MQSKIFRVDLHNFKSYCGDASVGPFQDFTCVVGPNGAGKSNLMDALCMVLSRGASIRGVPLKSFINRQSKDTRCSVSVVLRRSASQDTTPVDTTFSRQVNADGSSLFSINQSRVAEDTYFSSLAEHNIGARIQNFVVFQHEVEAVTRKTSLELTALIEDISGSINLKPDYELKKKRLEEATAALSKASLEKRGAAIEANQAKLIKREADRWSDVQNQLRKERWNLAMTELFYIETSLANQKEEVARFNETLDQLQKKIPSEGQIRTMKQQYVNQHKEYTAQLKKNRVASEEMRDKVSLLERAKASFDYLSHQQAAQEKELERMTKDSTRQSAELVQLTTQKVRYEGLLAEFDKEGESMDRDVTKALEQLSEEDHAEYTRLKAEAECQTVTLRQQLGTLESQLTAAEGSVQQSEAALEHTERRRHDCSEAASRLAAQKVELTARRGDLTASINELERKIKSTQRSQVENKKRQSGIQSELFKIQEQLRELRFVKDTNKHNSRMSEVVDALKAQHAVRGALVDLCHIPNGVYKSAVTVALGKNLDALVVDTTETAIQCVSYLKEQRFARMTFLPLEAVTGVRVTDHHRTFGGTCKPLVDVLEYDAALEPVIRYAVGDTLVCDTLEEAKRVAYGGTERYKVVTLEGTVLMKNGTIQGGLASVEGRARRWDEKRYDELRAARDRLQSEAASGGEAEQTRASVSLRDLTSRLDFSRERLKLVEVELASLEGKEERSAEDQQRLQEAEEMLKGRRAEQQLDVGRLKTEVERVKQLIGDVEGNTFSEMQKRIDVRSLLSAERRWKVVLQERSGRRQQLLVVLHRVQAAVESEENRIGRRKLEGAQNAFDRRAKEILEAKSVVGKLEKECKALSEKSAEARRGLASLREALDSLEVSIRQATRTSEEELHRLALARKGGAGLEAACETLRHSRLAVIRRCQMEGIELSLKPSSHSGSKRTRDQHASSSATLNSEPFSLLDSDAGSSGGSEPPHSQRGTVMVDFTELDEDLRSAASSRTLLSAYQEKTTTIIDKLTVELQSLAPQVKAAARFSSSEGRLGESSVVFDDARDAVRTAQAEFTAIGKQRACMFLETFEKLASTVDRIYKELTIGTRNRGASGSAYLSLEDTEVPFLGGTAYHVTPPLKRFMPMELLSGGERTMASLAFLFSVHAICPTPFFVLDEVDAALDAGNVEKLARYLRHNASNCQFIVVSHKDQLYYTADVLLGITNERKDESQILSLDLRGYSF